MVLASAFLFPVQLRGCGLAGSLSGKFIVATTALVDGFREEPQTGKCACLCLLATPTTAVAFVASCVGWFVDLFRKQYILDIMM
ncbi:hypothetical protein SporoP17a_13910 [Sporosarcina ureae]|nr:hypothetical protein SporoP17a_13910 [Sporosarcina ureae]